MILFKDFHYTVGSTVAIQRQDGGLWLQCTMVGQDNVNHNVHSYKIQMTKIGHIIIRSTQHVKRIPITTEQYILEQQPKEKDIENIQRKYSEAMST